MCPQAWDDSGMGLAGQGGILLPSGNFGFWSLHASSALLWFVPKSQVRNLKLTDVVRTATAYQTLHKESIRSDQKLTILSTFNLVEKKSQADSRNCWGAGDISY